MDTPERRSRIENLLDDLYGLKYEIVSDYDNEEKRVVMLKHHTIFVTLILSELLDFDVYADLSAGIYELGDLHSLTRKMLELKKLCLSYHAREMNTTERLYPANRRGSQTSTSGL